MHFRRELRGREEGEGVWRRGERAHERESAVHFNSMCELIPQKHDQSETTVTSTE